MSADWTDKTIHKCKYVMNWFHTAQHETACILGCREVIQYHRHESAEALTYFKPRCLHDEEKTSDIDSSCSLYIVNPWSMRTYPACELVVPQVEVSQRVDGKRPSNDGRQAARQQIP
jgi:hypothetical protein